MEIIWPDNDSDAICKFVDAVLVGFNAAITDVNGGVAHVLVQGVGHDGPGGMLRLFGTLLDDDWERVSPRMHFWIEWDDIARLEVH